MWTRYYSSFETCTRTSNHGVLGSSMLIVVLDTFLAKYFSRFRRLTVVRPIWCAICCKTFQFCYVCSGGPPARDGGSARLRKGPTANTTKSKYSKTLIFLGSEIFPQNHLEIVSKSFQNRLELVSNSTGTRLDRVQSPSRTNRGGG